MIDRPRAVSGLVRVLGESFQSGQEPGLTCQSPRGLMVGVQVLDVVRNDRIRAIAAEQTRQPFAALDGDLNATVGQVQVLAHVKSHGCGGGGEFGVACRSAAARAHLPVRGVDDADLGARIDQAQERPSDRDLGIVRMRGHNEYIQLEVGHSALASAVGSSRSGRCTTRCSVLIEGNSFQRASINPSPCWAR